MEALFRRIDREHNRLDILVNSVAGEDPLMDQWGTFWQANLKNADTIFRQALPRGSSRRSTRRGDDAPPTRADRRGDRERHARRRRQPDGAGGEDRAQGAGAELGGELKPHGVAVRRGHAGIPAVGNDAGALRRHRGQLARRREEGPEFSGSGVAAVRRPRDRRARSGSDVIERPAVVQLVGARARVPVHRLRRPSPGLGRAHDRLVGAPAARRRDQERHRPGTEVAGTSLAARTRRFQKKIPVDRAVSCRNPSPGPDSRETSLLCLL